MVYKVGMKRDVEDDEMTIYTGKLMRSASKKNFRKQVQRLIKIIEKGSRSTVQQTTTLQGFFGWKKKKKKCSLTGGSGWWRRIPFSNIPNVPFMAVTSIILLHSYQWLYS